MKKQTFRHGDLPIHPVSEKEVKGEVVKHNGSFVLALGEQTGHKHVITCERMTIRQDAHGYYLSLDSEATLTHEEHQTITLPPGIYFQGHEREHDWFLNATRRIVD